MKRTLFCIIILFPIYIFSQVQFAQLGQDIDGEAAGDNSGYSVSMNAAGDRVAIGAHLNNGNGSNAGHVRIYFWNGTTWTQQGQDINGEAAGDFSGWSVSMNAAGDIVAIGAINNDGNGTDAGHVRIYQWNGTSWIQQGQDIDGEAYGHRSGWSISMNAAGDQVAISAPYYNDGNVYSIGHVKIYFWNGTSWTQQGQDIDGEAAGDKSGYSVSMNATGDRVAIGAPENDGNGTSSGHVRIYAWNGTSWTQQGQDIDGEAYSDYSGTSVSMNAAGDRVAIGAYSNDGNGPNAGHVRVYEWNGTTWTQQGQDIDGEAAGDYSGCSVSMNALGDRVAIGAWGNDGNGTDAGHVRIYVWNGTSWTQQGQDIDGVDESGYSVSMNAAGDRVAIGAPYYDYVFIGGDEGFVRIYFQCNTIHTQNLSACDSYTWINGFNYNTSTSGINFTTQNSLGCDSVVILDLTINNSSSSTFNHIACDSYTWIDGNTYTSSTNTPTYTLTNAAGCDSTITLDLNILNSTTSAMTQVNCGAYVLNGIQYDVSGQYQQVTSNSVGCDSTINLDLTVIDLNPDFNANQQAYLNPPFMVQFNNNTPNQSQYDYTWNFGDGNTLQSQNPVVSHEYQYNGLYDVTLYANDQITGCTDSLYQHEFIYCSGGQNPPTGVNEQHAGDVTIYPNPTADNITLEVKHYQGPMEVTLFDINGKILITQTTTKINLENLPSGAYQMVVKYGEKQQAVRVLKN